MYIIGLKVLLEVPKIEESVTEMVGNLTNVQQRDGIEVPETSDPLKERENMNKLLTANGKDMYVLVTGVKNQKVKMTAGNQVQNKK